MSDVRRDDPALGLDRVLSSAVFYNFDYGFTVGTLSGDGDATDVLLLVDEPTLPAVTSGLDPSAVSP